MRKRLIEKLTKAKKGSLGYTLTEMLVVIGIIAVLCAIAIPAIFVISKSLKFTQRNNYAKSIFMAAQQNLTEMRSDGSLVPLQGDSINSLPVAEGQSGFPAEHWSDEYVYTASSLTVGAGQRDSYALVLPVGSVESTIRNKQVIIEYNPITGNVYSVFYSEDKDQNILEDYRNGTLPRNAEGDEEKRKEMMLGYYDGSGLSSTELELESTQAEVEFTNGEEGIVTVKIPMPSLYYGRHSVFMEGLEVYLDITGDLGGSVNVQIKESGNIDNCELDIDGKTVLVTYVLDSLKDYGSFANVATGNTSVTSESLANGGTVINSSLASGIAKRVSELQDTDFPELTSTDCKILPGDNVTIRAEVKFINTGSNPAVTIGAGVLAGVNPMFEYLEPSGTASDKYILAVSNGRNMQNLNAIHPDVAAQVESVVFTSDIYWNQTVSYYNTKYGTENGTYSNNVEEAPARALPYFVPIHSEHLFGTAKFVFPTNASYSGFLDFFFQLVSGTLNNKVPTLTDEYDDGDNATISGYNADNPTDGNVAKIYYLNIDTTKYCVGKEFYAGTVDADIDRFTGLFSYVNTTVDNLEVVNPIVKGYYMTDSNNPATGALIGAGGYNTLVTNCAVYIDTTDPAFSRAAMTQAAYDASANQGWYGVSGEGAVGGLIGYAKSHRTVKADLTNDEAYLAFSNCFAAVNVSGNMRGSGSTNHYGYSNGVGGFIGNSQLTNFYNCYSSGNVIGSGYYVTGNISSGWYEYLNLYHSGRQSMGVGGFVGTSHGTRYTNCFATGDVNASGTTATDYSGSGGFVGIMCYDETFAYGHDEGSSISVAQHTVFNNCYAVGLCNTGKGYRENFSGANARIRISMEGMSAYYTGDYYKLLAPHYLVNNKYPDYQTLYIFKDSYYLSQYGDDAEQDNSNKCSTAATYDLLTALHDKHRDTVWINSQLDTLKAQGVGWEVIRVILSDFSNLWEALTNPYYSLYFDAAEKKGLDMEAMYTAQYKKGFPANEWTSASAATTHSYSLNAAGSVYPFSKLVGLDYYGDWPNKPLTAGLAYYEVYEDGSTGFYFDRDITSTLKHDQLVVSDGYAILTSGSKDTVTITIGDKQYVVTSSENPVTLGSVERPGANSYYYAFMPEAAMQQASDIDFYTKITVKIDSETYTMYFNPNVALTQVNPVSGTKATEPDVIPTQIYIRSARQFAAISNMENFWSKDFNYVQQLNIDADKYKWTEPELSPIGTSENPFQGTYSGNGGYVDQPVLDGFVPGVSEDKAVMGLFGIVGETGKVENLQVQVSGVSVAAADAAASAGVLSGICNGTISQVDLILGGEVTVNASAEAGSYAGLLAGQLTGTLEDSTVVADDENDTIVLSADYAGGAVGYAQEAEISGTDVTMTNGSAISGDHAGGFTGYMKDSTAESVDVQLKTMAVSADAAGGFAGTVSGGKATSVTVTLTGTSSNAKTSADGAAVYMAGLVGAADKAEFASVSTVLQGTISGHTAAGMFGTLNDTTVKNSGASISGGSVVGTANAAGAVAVAETGSVIESTFIKLVSGSVKSEGRAAGFAVEFAGTTDGVGVQMGRYTYNEGKTQVTGAYDGGVIEGGTQAAGFACTVSGSVNKGTVVGAGSIQSASGDSAGFAAALEGDTARIAASYVTPAMDQSAECYLGNTNANLSVSGDKAAGFVLAAKTDNSSSTTAGIYNSYTLCEISGSNVYGFLGSNTGKVDGCTANVTLSGGYAFAGENSGLISNSYGWYGDGQLNNTTTVSDSGTYNSCYFVDLDVPELQDGESGNTVVLFNTSGTKVEMLPSALSGSLGQLNGSSTRWFTAGTYGSNPYKQITPKDYLYPMLRAHYGNWITPPQYAYGVAYYEKYDNGSYKVHVVDLSDPEITVETGSLSYRDGAYDNDCVIAETGYALFCKTGSTAENNPFTDPKMLGELLDIPTARLNPAKQNEDGSYTETKRYSFYKLNADPGEYEISGTAGSTAKVVTYYADAINEDQAYEIRTPEQLSYVGKKASSNFTQTHDITVTGDLTTVESFSGTYTGNGRKLAASATTKGWMNGVSNKVENLSLTLGDVDVSIFGDVTGTVALTDLTVGAIGANGSIAGKANSFTVTGATSTGAVSGKLFGNVTTAELTGGLTINGAVSSANGAVESVVTSFTTAPTTITGEVSGKLFGTTSGTVSTGAVSIGGAVSGTLVDTVSAGSVTSSGITVGTASAPLAVSGKLFNTINGGSVTTGAIKLGAIGENAAIFGAVGANVKTDAITTGNVSGNLIDAVSAGETTLGNIQVGTIGSSSAVIGTVGGNTVSVKTGTITTGNISGKLINTVSAGAVSLGNITANLTTAVTPDPTEGTTQPVTESQTVAASGEGTEVITGGTVPTLFGTVSGGSLSGSTVSLSGGVISDNLFGEISGGEVSGFNVSAQSMTHSLVGTLNGSLNNVDITCASGGAITGSGILVNTLNGGSVTNCDVSIGGAVSVTASGDTFSFGGITGTVPSGVTLSSNAVTADMNVTGADGTLAVIGGLVGINNGTISDKSAATADITYTQTASDRVRIGGLVGWMQSGSISDAAAGGSISLNGFGSARSMYFIGGAVAYDGGAAYTNVGTTVTIADAWQGCQLVTLADNNSYTWETAEESIKAINPSGLGPVGKFVGYVSTGTFTNCTATGSGTTAAYQFLGEIAPASTGLNQASLGKKAAEKVDSFTEECENTKYAPDQSAVWTDWYEGEHAAGTKYRIFNAELSDCTFDLAGVGTVQQTLDAGNYYFYKHNGAEDVKLQLHKAGDRSNNLSYTSRTYDFNTIYNWIMEGNSGVTDFYYLDDGTYYRVTAEATSKTTFWGTEYERIVTLTYNGSKTIKATASLGLFGSWSWDRDNCTLHTVSESVDAANSYVLVSEDGTKMLAVQSGTVQAVDLTSFVADATDMQNGYLWKRIDGAFAFVNNAEITKATTLDLLADSYSSETQKYMIDGAAYYLHSLTEQSHGYRATFILSGEYNHICTYVSAGQPAAASEDVTDLPAESGEVVEAPAEETTAPAETASLPEKAVTGKETNN